MTGDDDLETLRAAFVAQGEDAAAAPDCPPAERIWAAVDGGLPGAETRGLIRHTAACPACAETWRLALELGRTAEAEDLSRGRPVVRATVWRRGMAVAAALSILVLGWQLYLSGTAPDPSFREGGEAAVRSLVPAGEALPRTDARLRWTGPEGARYEVLVMDENLETVARAEDLEEEELVVPPPALAALPPGTRLLWQVEAVLPDGRRLSSPTFVLQLD